MVTFDQSLDAAIACLLDFYPDIQWQNARIIRDMQGTLFVVLPDELVADAVQLEQVNQAFIQHLEHYVSTATPVVGFSQTLMGTELLDDPYVIHRYQEHAVYFIERRAMGEPWLLRPEQVTEPHPPRFVFFSLKGGVGRSTALALWARELCSQGKTVLVVDMDLEAPGLGAQLLERSGKPLYGVGDWLVEDLVGNTAEDLIADMAQQSPIVPAGLWVVPAFGILTDKTPHNMLAKLARAYLDKPTEQGQESFTVRLQKMLQALEAQYQPDVVLIDSRAGLHETVASTLLHLNAEVLCFAVDLEVTWQGYRYLFSHIAQLAQHAQPDSDWRDRFKMVSARSDLNKFAHFVGQSFGVWSDTLYEYSSGDLGSEFSFDERDEAAPHYPLVIPRSDTFEAFEPCQDLQGLHEAQIQSVFGAFFTGLAPRLEVIQHADE